MLAALTTHLHTPENLAALAGEVNALLRECTRHHAREQAADDTAARLREVEAEIAHITQRQVEAEIRGDLSRVLYLAGTKVPQGGKQIRWLGIITDLRTALKTSPVPPDVLKELLGEAA